MITDEEREIMIVELSQDLETAKRLNDELALIIIEACLHCLKNHIVQCDHRHEAMWLSRVEELSTQSTFVN